MKKIKILLSFGLALGASTFSVAQQEHQGSVTQPLQNMAVKHLENERLAVRSHLDSVSKDSGVEFSEQDVIIGQRIQRIQQTIPLEYNAKVKAYLDKYISRNYKPYMEKLLGLTQFYFPIYESIFEQSGIPDEVKYLSVVESSLNPHTHSSAGAVGPWQFIYGTAKIYDLSMDSYMDERKDAYSSTYAVSKYIMEAYDEFNDWLLALASYNCGRGCVRRAIKRSGLRAPSYWELSPFLPKETQNYIPKYIAMTYVLNHPEDHGLTPQATALQQDHTVLMVDKHVDMKTVADAVNTSVDVLTEFNPAYKKQIVNGTVEQPKRLIVPLNDQLNDSLLYLALNNQSVPVQQEVEHHVEKSYANQLYTVPKGESIVTAAKKNGVKVQELIAWNNLNESSQISEKTLIIKKNVDTGLVQNVEKAKFTQKTEPRYTVYTIRKGDTLSGIVKRYRGATIAKLKSDNKLKSNKLSVGKKLKIYHGKG